MIDIIMKAKFIPIGTTVYKKTGEKPYILKDKIRIFTENGQEVLPYPALRKSSTLDEEKGPVNLFLVADGDINVVSSEKEFKIRFDDPEEFYWFAHEFRESFEIPQ